MEVKKFPSEMAYKANMITQYQMANAFDFELFIVLEEQLNALICNLRGAIISSFGGEKEAYKQLKEMVNQTLTFIFDEHDKVVDVKFRELNKNKH